METKRITLLCGHYGSGKTNIAVNLALALKQERQRVAIADLDIVNPYFRTNDSREELENAGVRLICSDFAGTNLDAPALPPQIYSITADREQTVVVDVGGDERGALALGRLSQEIVGENNFENILVINRYRPLTADARSTYEIMREIEAAGRVPFTAIANNSNLGYETTAQTVLNSIGYADEISRITGLPVIMTAVREDLYDELRGEIPNIFPLKLQRTI